MFSTREMDKMQRDFNFAQSYAEYNDSNQIYFWNSGNHWR